jgi:uncharacterized protein YndB with AHSA1/START domain
MTLAATTSPSESLSLAITRVFDAPRSLVFEAWIRPEHVLRWWGCHLATLRACAIDFRPGGAYRFVMRDASGGDIAFKGVYREIVPPARLVYTQEAELECCAERATIVTVTFDDRDGRTALTTSFAYQSAEARDRDLKSGMLEKASAAAFDRLAHVLRTMA